MPKKSVKVEFKNFIKGLITEASPVNFPAEASYEEENFILNRNGTRERRLGIDFEENAEFATVNTSPENIAETYTEDPYVFEWRNVNGDANKTIIVVQVNNKLFFFDEGYSALSQGMYSTNNIYGGDWAILTYNLYDYTGSLVQSGIPTPSGVKYSMTSVDGKLVIVTGAPVVHIITFRPEASPGSEFSASSFPLASRDIWGIGQSETSGDTGRPALLHPNQRYNRQNQSWGIPRKDSTNTLVDPLEKYKTDLTRYPSNSEAVWAGLQYQPVATGQTPFERMYTNMYTDALGASTSTARGGFIIDLIRRGVYRQAAVYNNNITYPTLFSYTLFPPLDYLDGGPTVVTEFAGRIWYGGFKGENIDTDDRSPDLSNYVAFSQLVRNTASITRCYQEGDPTSRETSDVVDTDGGLIRISGVGNIVRFVNLSSHLLVIADNGVWAISGGSDYGFTATNYKVERITTFGALGASSVITDGSRLMYWSEDGIYVIAKNDAGAYAANNLTQTTIQTLYEGIDMDVRANATGIYDPIGKRIRWIYREGRRFNADSVTKELVLDLTLSAFYLNRIYNNVPDEDDTRLELIAGIRVSPFTQIRGVTNVVADGENVIVVGGDFVSVPDNTSHSSQQAIKYLCLRRQNGNTGTLSFTFGYYKDNTFADWKTSDGVGADARAYLITGQYTADDSSIHKQIPYLTLHFYRTEKDVNVDLEPLNASGCFIRTKWDWATGYNSNKWSPLMQAYRYRKAYIPSGPADTYDTGFGVVTSRNKLRGRGKAFSLHFETEPGKDCRIIGWSLALNGNQVT